MLLISHYLFIIIEVLWDVLLSSIIFLIDNLFITLHVKIWQLEWRNLNQSLVNRYFKKHALNRIVKYWNSLILYQNSEWLLEIPFPLTTKSLTNVRPICHTWPDQDLYSEFNSSSRNMSNLHQSRQAKIL